MRGKRRSDVTRVQTARQDGLPLEASDVDAPSLAAFEDHSARHENGGADEINVAGLSGELADPQPPKAHQTSHNSGGSDALKLDDLAAPDDNTDLNASTSKHGLLQKLPGGTSTFLRADGSFASPAGGAPAAHATSHQNGGSDEISVAGLSGLLADGQTPLAHKTSHENGGSDELSVAGLSGLLADPQDPTLHASDHEDGGSDELDVTALGGFPGGTTDFLRADGTFADPGSGGGSSSEWSVLTNSDPINPEVMFDSDGDVLMTELP